MAEFELCAQFVRDDGVDLVPCNGFVAGNVIRLTDSVRVAHEPNKALGEVRVVRDRPQGRAVAVDEDGLALHHPAHDLPRALVALDGEGQAALVVGMARADDGDREAVFPVHAHEVLFAGNFIAGVCPVRIGQRRALGDQIVRKRFLVCRGRGDEHELLRPAGKEAEIALKLVGREGDKIAHAVKRHAFKRLCRLHLVTNVRGDGPDAVRQLA